MKGSLHTDSLCFLLDSSTPCLILVFATQKQNKKTYIKDINEFVQS